MLQGWFGLHYEGYCRYARNTRVIKFTSCWHKNLTHNFFSFFEVIKPLLDWSYIWDRALLKNDTLQFSLEESIIIGTFLFVTCPLWKSRASRCSLFPFFRFLSPLSAVPLVSLVGFGLFELGFPGVSFFLCSFRFQITYLSSFSLQEIWRSPRMLGCQMCGNWTARACPFGVCFTGISFKQRIFSVLFRVRFSYKEDIITFLPPLLTLSVKSSSFSINFVCFLCSICLTWSNLANTYSIVLQSFSVWW